jgi:uroporphyrinogen decarboxylase
MSPRERFLETILFGSPDKIPFEPGTPRESTLKRWQKEGLSSPEKWFDVCCTYTGIPPDERNSTIYLNVSFRMNPMFEEKILEHKDGHYIIQDWMGNITEISDQYDPSYIRHAKDFVTRKWHKFPVENMNDFEEMKKRYIPDDPVRYPSNSDNEFIKLKQRRQITTIVIPGLFWQLREWCGFEPLCMMFIDNPEFVREMLSFWGNFVSAVMKRVLNARILDRIIINEDMAYKEKSMISPEMARNFLLPVWAKWAQEARNADVQIIEIDSDGCVDELIPVWIDAGINCCSPMEVVAGTDLNKLRHKFGKKMAFRGGINKQCIAKGGESLQAELNRLKPVIQSGGYIPGCDHAVPPDVSWQNFLEYCKLLAKLTGW